MSLLLYYMRRAVRSAAEAYRDRVLADGGTIFSMAAVEAAYAQATAWGLPEATTHWTSPRFGYRTSGQQIEVRYCLFGHDATPAGAAGSWTVLPAATGKAPQHYTNKFALQFAGLPWTSIDLAAHVVMQSASWQADAYPYFPLIESSGNPGAFGGFLLSGEAGVMEGGYTDPGGLRLAQSTSLPPINTLATVGLQLDKALPASPRLWVNGTAAGGQYSSGQPTLAAYAQQTVYLGARGGAQNYAFNGNINDVFVTNKVLPASALDYLNNQKNAY